MGLSNNNSIFGLDIGYETLKLVQLQKKGKQFSLIGYSEIPLTERILERDSFKNKATTANLIKEACRKAKPSSIRAKRIVSALPETFVFSKTIQMPKMSTAEYEKSVPIEAAQYLPIPVEDVYLDYQILIVHPDEPLVDILLVASPKKLVDEYVEITKMAGFELMALETKPIAVGRAIAVTENLDGLVIIEVGSEVSRVAIWDSSNIRLITSIAIGKNQIAESLGAIDNTSKLSIKGEGPEASIAIKTIIDEVLNAIKYHQNRDYKPNPIKKIILSGSGAAIAGMDEEIEKQLKIKTEIVRPTLANKQTLGPEFITSYGLALRSEYE